MRAVGAHHIEEMVSSSLTFHPLTPDRWPDLEALFAERGDPRECWCMWWRLTRAEFDRGRGEGNRRALKQIVDSGRPPGLIAYAGGEPAGWCSLGPRQDFGSLERSRRFARVDDRPVWSIVCFFVSRRYRRRGLMQALLAAAIQYAADRGAQVVEAYPVEPGEQFTGSQGYMGLIEAFHAAGFVEIARRVPGRPIMRRLLAPPA